MIIRVKTNQELERYRRELTNMYIACFAEPPWREVFTEAEVWEWFMEMMSFARKIVLCYLMDGEVMGATFNFPVANKADVLTFLPNGYLPDEVCYLAEMFVNPKIRRHGIAKELHQERLKIASLMGYKAAIQRTNLNSKMFPLILKTGFEVIGKQEVMSLKSIAGAATKATDLRAMSLKRL